MENRFDPIVIKYNNDLNFRKMVAFNRVYHSANVKKRVAVELAIAVICVIAAVTVWFAMSGVKNSTYIFYAFMIVAVVFAARYARAALNRYRIKPADPKRAEREFMFDDAGFMFGPINDEGETVMNHWGDVDRAYITGDVIYFLCMSRKNWAAIDKRLIVSGEWGDLVELVHKKLPRFKIYDLTKKGLVK
ncbi:MAG: hypothetical protein IJC56_10875 [Clostridia bacterium]|nr:hypothetical protein [Clostridia bacterium]